MFNKIQTKITIFITVTSALFILGLLLFSRAENKKFENILKDRTTEKEHLVASVIKTLDGSLITFANDYSYWDEMMNFVSSKDTAWSFINIESSLNTFKANYAWVYDINLNLVYSTIHSNNTSLKRLPVDMETLKKALAANWFQRFFVSTPDGLVEICCAPIQSSKDIKRKSKPTGFFFTGRIWNNNYLKEIQNLSSGDSIKLLSIEEDFITELANQQNGLTFTCRETLFSLDNRPISVLMVIYSFPMMQEAIDIARIQMIYLVLFIFIMLFSISYFLYQYLSKPLKVISKSIETNDGTIIRKLRKNKTEFGRLAYLIIDFFHQKEILKKEILDRITTERILKEKVMSLQLIKAINSAFQKTLDLEQIFQRVDEIIPFYFSCQGNPSYL
ncbi:MAG: CHASE4 domain-containing protein [Ignavibacteria bacterium]